EEIRHAMSDAPANPMKAGLEDVVVSTSDICCSDGHKGRLLYRGFDVDDLVAPSTLEEGTYRLWYGKLPSRKELDAHVKALSSTANRKLPPKLITMLRQLPKKTTPMEVLRTGVSALSAFDPDAADNSREATLRKSIRLTAQMPTLVAAWERIRRGKPVVAPNPKLSLSGNFLYMMTGRKPTGPATKADAWIRQALADKARIMGFGHRVYRVEDPRAKHLKRLALELGQQAGSTVNIQILDIMAGVVSAAKHIFPNVDLYSGAAYASMGISTDQFTPIFAMSRVAGWAAHILEQHRNKRLIPPRPASPGAPDAQYLPLAQR